jgi:hypothetical protein
MISMIAALPFAARPQQTPFDASRMVADLTEALQLTPEQTARLNDLLTLRRPRIDQILQQMSQFPPGSSQFNELRGQVERERRALLGELAPSLRPEQQVRLRGLMGAPPGNPPSPVAPLKPNLPSGAFATGERLIKLPPRVAADSPRNHRASSSLPQIS